MQEHHTIATAPTTPVTCDFAPACSATAVREPLVLTGKPWKNPAAMFAAPMPSISRFPSISLPLRPANAEAVAMVSASETRAMPNAPPIRSGMSDAARGNRERGKALRQRPDEVDAVIGEAECGGGRDRDDHRGEHARDLRPEPLQHEHHEPGDADGE